MHSPNKRDRQLNNLDSIIDLQMHFSRRGHIALMIMLITLLHTAEEVKKNPTTCEVLGTLYCFAMVDEE